MAAKLSILLTGAGGRMASVLRPALRERYGALRLVARRALDDLHPTEDLTLCDLTDIAGISRAAEGVDAIVHLGGVADEAPFETVLKSNVIGTYNVFEAARLRGVRRVVFASTNHVTGFYSCGEEVGVGDPVRPDSRYAVSKVFGEALGSLYASKWGLEVVSLRIGSFREAPRDRRQLSTWLSHRDGIELTIRALEAPVSEPVTLYGVSANRSSWWKSEQGATQLGFEPVDDADSFAASVQEDGGEGQFQGGRFTNRDYEGGYF